MTDNPDHASIAEALAAFQLEAPSVYRGKTATIPGRDGKTGYSYQYADLADVAKAAYPVLAKHGLSFVAIPDHVENVGLVLRGVLLHSSGERLEGLLTIAGRDPQSLGSAITYGRRYLLGCMTGIVTDDDDDAGAAMATPAPAQGRPDPAALYTAAVKASEAENAGELRAVLETVKAMGLDHFAIPGGPWVGKPLGDVIASMLAAAPGGDEPARCEERDDAGAQCEEWADHEGPHAFPAIAEVALCSGWRKDDGVLCSKPVGHGGQHKYDRPGALSPDFKPDHPQDGGR